MTTQPTNESGELLAEAACKLAFDPDFAAEMALRSAIIANPDAEQVTVNAAALKLLLNHAARTPNVASLVSALERARKFLRSEDGHGFGTQDMEDSEFFRQAGLLCDEIDEALATYRETGA